MPLPRTLVTSTPTRNEPQAEPHVFARAFVDGERERAGLASESLAGGFGEALGAGSARRKSGSRFFAKKRAKSKKYRAVGNSPSPGPSQP